jgi:hypothetical protein
LAPHKISSASNANQKGKQRWCQKKNAHVIFLKYSLEINLFIFLPTAQKGYACHHHSKKKLALMSTLNGLERIVNLNYSLLSFLIRIDMSPTKT